jgi:UDP-2-acetamido-2,6-beta-L-arabino-hexul-4-ose reductase
LSERTVLVEAVKLNSDPRGYVFEPVNQHELAAQGNSHIVVSEPGAIRGNHYHVRGREITVVVGPCLVRYRDVTGAGPVHELMVPAGSAQRLTFPAGVAHAFRYPGPGLGLLAVFNSEVHDPAQPDVVREVLI